MALWGGGLRKGFSVAAFLLEVAQLSPLFLSLHHSPYAIGIPAAVALVLNPRMGGFVYILRPCIRDWQFLPPPQSPLVFTARSYAALLPGSGTLGCTVWPRAVMACSPDVPPSFYLPHMNMGPPVLLATTAAASLLLPHSILSALAPHLHLISTLPPHLDEYFFFKSWVVRLPHSLIFWQFWLYFVLRLVVILRVVVRGGEVCVPMPPSWPEVLIRSSWQNMKLQNAKWKLTRTLCLSVVETWRWPRRGANPAC